MKDKSLFLAGRKRDPLVEAGAVVAGQLRATAATAGRLTAIGLRFAAVRPDPAVARRVKAVRFELAAWK